MKREAYLELLSRGYPYLRILVEARGEGALEAAKDYAASGFHERHVPRDVALFALRLPQDFAEDDVAALVEKTLATPRIEGPRFVLEALVGTETLVARIVRALEERTKLSEDARQGLVVEGEFRALGMMLRRLPLDSRAHYMDNLRVLAPRISPDAVRAFEIVAGGFAKVAELGKRDARGELSAYDLIFADDNASAVANALRKMHIDDSVRPNIRLAHLAGEEGLVVLCGRALEFSPAFLPIFAEDFAPMESPVVEAALARLRATHS